MEANTYFLTIRFGSLEKRCPFSVLVVKFSCSPRSRDRYVHKILSRYSRFYDVDTYVVSTDDFPSSILLLISLNSLI
uniref:Uncharacterized protein n=1 Tax=Dulem virus 223 TaxID=3145700 RepID=A0AAU8AZ55_9VIRU